MSKYSIFLPVKNGEAYIAKAIESVLSQQFRDFSLIVLENKSSDNTLKIIRSYSDPRIRIVESVKPLSIYENWRRVYDLLSTKTVEAEFCTIIGHDDVLYPFFLLSIEKLTSSYPAASLFQTHFNIIDENDAIVRPCKPVPAQETYRDFFLSRCWSMRDSSGTGYVCRVRDYVRIGGIPDLPLLLWSDDLMIMRLMRLSYKVADSDIGFAYRLHGRSTSAAITRNKFVSFIEATKQFVNIVQHEFGELVSDVYGKVSLGYAIKCRVTFLKTSLSGYVFSPAVDQTLTMLDVLSTELLRSLDSEILQVRNPFHKLEQVARKFYYLVRLAFLR